MPSLLPSHRGEVEGVAGQAEAGLEVSLLSMRSVGIMWCSARCVTSLSKPPGEELLHCPSPLGPLGGSVSCSQV